MKIRDITGQAIQVTNLNKAVKQCKLCQNSPFKMDSEHTIGENYAFLLRAIRRTKTKNKDLTAEKK